MGHEFRVTVVATREHYEADGSVVPPGTRRPADPDADVPHGWRLDVERAEVEPPTPEPEQPAPEPPPESKPTTAVPSRPSPQRGGRRAP